MNAMRQGIRAGQIEEMTEMMDEAIRSDRSRVEMDPPSYSQPLVLY